jgi:hypothetical protein
VTRVLTTVSAILALAVSAAPVAAAGPSKKPPPRGAWGGIHEHGHVNNINAGGGWDPTLRHGLKRKPKQGAIVYNGHAGLGANARVNIVTDNKDPDKLG